MSISNYIAGLVIGWATQRMDRDPEQPPNPRKEPSLTTTSPRAMRIRSDAAANLGRKKPPRMLADNIPQDAETFRVARPLPGVVPPEFVKVAQDEAYVGQAGGHMLGDFGGGHRWLGFPYLAELTQVGEYRRIVETMAREMTRRWIELKHNGGGDKDDRIPVIVKELERHGIQQKFRRVAELDGYFGRGHLFIDTGVAHDDDELLKVAVIQDRRTFAMGDLEGFRVVEPTWTYPGLYNSTNPMARDFYLPTTWYVMGKQVHRTRLLTFVSREMPDLLKPAYAFGGLSMSQMAKPNIDKWFRAQDSVSDLMASFSTSVLKTNMSAILGGGGSEAEELRAQVFNTLRDNRGLFMIDKETEDFSNVSTSLGTLDHLQAQAQEHVASVTGEPLVIMTGISPSGLNATGEQELQVWDQVIASNQEHLFRPHLQTVINLIQLDKFGEIDPNIVFTFLPLKEESDEEMSTRRKTESDMDNAYIAAGVLDPAEVREKLSKDEDSPYSVVDLSGPPPDPPDQGGDPLQDDTGGDESSGAKPTDPGNEKDPQGSVRAAAEGDHVNAIAKHAESLNKE